VNPELRARLLRELPALRSVLDERRFLLAGARGGEIDPVERAALDDEQDELLDQVARLVAGRPAAGRTTLAHVIAEFEAAGGKL